MDTDRAEKGLRDHADLPILHTGKLRPREVSATAAAHTVGWWLVGTSP